MRRTIAIAGLLVALTTQLAAIAHAADPITLTIHMHFRDKYVWREDWPVAREIERQTGVRLKNVASTASASSREAFNLMLASGKLPDIVAGDGLKSAFLRYGMEGAFRPLGPLISAHAPNLAAFLAAHPGIARTITAPDGEIYFIPYVPDGTFARGWFIRADWLDKLGLKTPETVDELYTTLVAFRDRDPNGNGRRDEVPFFVREAPELGRLFTLWGARSSGSETPHDFMAIDGRVQHPYAAEAYRTAIRNVARWYREGLIDKEVFTRGARAREVLLGNDQGGVTHDWFASTALYNTSLASRVKGLRFVAFAPPASVSGVRLAESRRARVRPDGWAITTASQHPIAVIRLFDFLFTPRGRRLSNFGVEGVHHDVIDGAARFKPQVLNAKTPVNTQMWEIGAQIPVGFWQDYAYERQWTDPVALAGIALYEQGRYLAEDFSGVAMAPAERRLFDRKWPGILSFMLERQQAWVLGARDVDADWPEYNKRLAALGLSLVMEAMQAAQDRQGGAK
jgi:putative aldouronate transport system substrate-binding protein